jgi:uncharacterized damage-inducible protein DinB
LGPLLIEAFRYHKWANLQLLEVCAGLEAEQLQLTSTGTYGSIAATFLHLAAAEQRYVKRLGGSAPQLSEKSEFPGIDWLRGQMERSGDELLALAGRVRPDDTTPAEGTFHVRHWVPIVQSLHHGNDHRTHICTILGQNGIDYPDLDVWAYARVAGGYVTA